MSMKKRILQTAGAGILLALLSSGAQAISLANPGFDADDATGGDVGGASGWDAFGGGTVFTTDGISGPGAFPNCCSPVPRSNNNSLKVFSIGGVQQDFAATAGDIFNMSGFGLNFGSDPILSSSKILLQIAFLDSDGKPAGTEAGGQVAPGFNIFDSNAIDATTPQDIWTEMGVGTNAAPDNTATVRFIVLGLLGSGGAGFFDDISANQVVVPVPAAVWLFGSGLIGLVGVARRRKAQA